MTSRPERNELSSTLRTVANLQTVYNHNEGSESAREETSAQTRAESNRQVQDGGEIQPPTSNPEAFPAPAPGQNNSTPDQRRENLNPG